jgi:hypothetical protein
MARTDDSFPIAIGTNSNYPSDRLARLNREYKLGGRLGRKLYALAAFLQMFCLDSFFTIIQVLDQLPRGRPWKVAVVRGLKSMVAEPTAVAVFLAMLVAFCLGSAWTGANIGEGIVAGKITNKLHGAVKFLLPALFSILVLIVTASLIHWEKTSFGDLLFSFVLSCVIFLPISFFTGFVTFVITQTLVKRRLAEGK